MTRFIALDFLRVVVVIVVVFRHTYPLGPDQLMLTSVSVPFFFFVTGWLFRPGRRTIAAEWRTRWATLGRPYVVWLAILCVIVLVRAAAEGRASLELLVGPIRGGMYAFRPFTTFWFLSTLIFVALLLRALERVPRWMLGIIGILSLGLGNYAGAQLAPWPIGLGLSLGALTYAIAGRLLNELVPRNAITTAVAGVVLPLSVIASLPLAHLDIKQGDFGTPVATSVVAVALIWSLIVVTDAVFAALPPLPRFGAALSALARVALVVVLLHPTVLWLAEPTTTPMVFVAALLVPWVVALYLQTTRASPWLVGQPQLGCQPEAGAMPASRNAREKRSPASS